MVPIFGTYLRRTESSQGLKLICKIAQMETTPDHTSGLSLFDARLTKSNELRQHIIEIVFVTVGAELVISEKMVN